MSLSAGPRRFFIAFPWRCKLPAMFDRSAGACYNATRIRTVKFVAVKILVTRIDDTGAREYEDEVAEEFPMQVVLNGQPLVTMMCSPSNVDWLAVGFLASEGLISRREDIHEVVFDKERGAVRVATRNPVEMPVERLARPYLTSGCGKGTTFGCAPDHAAAGSRLTVPAETVHTLVREFQRRSELYKATGGVHSAAFCRDGTISVFAEDIGRHNAVDKVLGFCLLNGIPTDAGLIVTSGRISSEVVHKVARRGTSIVVSKSAPTSLAVRLAEELNITLVGFARGRRMNVYTADWRIAAP